MEMFLIFFYHTIKIKKYIIEPIGVHNPGYDFDKLTQINRNIRFNTLLS